MRYVGFFVILVAHVELVASGVAFVFLFCAVWSGMVGGAFLAGVPASDESMESWSCSSSRREITLGSKGAVELVVEWGVPACRVGSAEQCGCLQSSVFLEEVVGLLSGAVEKFLTSLAHD